MDWSIVRLARERCISSAPSVPQTFVWQIGLGERDDADGLSDGVHRHLERKMSNARIWH